MNAFFQELFQAGIYKRSQGRITRQVTMAVLFLTMVVGAWRLHTEISSPPKFFLNWAPGASGWWEPVRWGVPFVVGLAGIWIAYRLVNLPRFADFLIAVEAEMNKVSWPTWPELVRSSVVVLVTIFVLSFVLAGFDAVWSLFFNWLGIFGS